MSKIYNKNQKKEAFIVKIADENNILYKTPIKKLTLDPKQSKIIYFHPKTKKDLKEGSYNLKIKLKSNSKLIAEKSLNINTEKWYYNLLSELAPPKQFITISIISLIILGLIIFISLLQKLEKILTNKIL